MRCQSSLGEWFRASQRGVKSLKNQLYGFVSLSCVEEGMGPNSVQQHGMLSPCLIGKSTPCDPVALHNSFALLGPFWTSTPWPAMGPQPSQLVLSIAECKKPVPFCYTCEEGLGYSKGKTKAAIQSEMRHDLASRRRDEL